MNIVWAFADTPSELNTSYHRVLVPSRILSETGRHHCTMLHASFLSDPDPEVQKTLAAADIIVLERLLLKETQPLIDQWHQAGKRVIATFDDAYHLMPKSGGIPEKTWRGGKRAVVGKNSDGSDRVGSILNEFRQTLRLVDAALVPSRVLAEDYRPYCPNITYVPNIPYLPLWRNVKRRPPDGNFVIGWGGSTAHDQSWLASGLPQALGLLCKKYPRLQLHLQGRDPRIQLMLDKANVRYTSHLWVPFEAWPRVVATFDLGVAPLTTDGYDLRRSYLKAWEYALGGMPWVATQGPVYQEALGGVLVENRAQAWADAISRLIERREVYESFVQAGREWAESLYAGAAEMYEQSLGI